MGAWNMDQQRKAQHKAEHDAAVQSAIFSGATKSGLRDLAVVFGVAAGVLLLGKTFTAAVG